LIQYLPQLGRSVDAVVAAGLVLSVDWIDQREAGGKSRREKDSRSDFHGVSFQSGTSPQG
jgi:hypothetical protein